MPLFHLLWSAVVGAVLYRLVRDDARRELRPRIVHRPYEPSLN